MKRILRKRDKKVLVNGVRNTRCYELHIKYNHLENGRCLGFMTKIKNGEINKRCDNCTYFHENA